LVSRWLERLLIGALIALPFAVAFELALRDAQLRSRADLSGWWLLALVLGLSLLGARKKLPVIPLGSARAWVRLHTWGGLAAIGLFGLHVDWRVPSGVLECALAGFFVLVAASGLLGLLLSRLLPMRLATRGQALLFERIPAARAALRREVADLVVGSVEAGGANLLVDFYERRLLHFFSGPRHLLAHWMDLESPRSRILAEIDALERYAREGAREPGRDQRPCTAQGRAGLPVRPAGPAEVLALPTRSGDVGAAARRRGPRAAGPGISRGGRLVAQAGPTQEKESGWERPNRAWVCGRSERRRLRGGADRAAAARCARRRPQRRGERWQCTRPPGAARVRRPAPGWTLRRPLPPCAPVHSLLWRRGALGRWLVAGVAAVLAVALGSPLWQAVFSPGELSSHHRVLVDGCAACHPAARADSGWLGGAPAQGPTSQSAQCVACHDLGQAGERTHGVPVADLAQRIAQAGPATGGAPGLLRLAALGPAFALAPDRALACATCHPEHRGAQDDLTDVSDLRCQTCHVARFQDLARGHPDFSSYPHQRRTRIVFDHSSHRGKHFPRRPAEFRCMDCHEIDAAGEGMGVPGFERACASCHADDVSAAALRPGQRGIVFHSGQDPAASRFLTLLGAGDPPLAPAQVLSALAEGGQRAFGERLSAALGRELPAEERAALAGGLPREILLAEAGPAPAGVADRARENWVEQGWFRQSSDGRSYRPRGHADASCAPGSISQPPRADPGRYGIPPASCSPVWRAPPRPDAAATATAWMSSPGQTARRSCA
jgi:hypothetical protein